jgi:hypothetical protein
MYTSRKCEGIVEQAADTALSGSLMSRAGVVRSTEAAVGAGEEASVA